MAVPMEKLDLSREELKLQEEVERITRHPVVSPLREPLIKGDKTYSDVTEDINRIHEGEAGLGWWIAFWISSSLLIVGVDRGLSDGYDRNRHMGFESNRRLGV